MRRNDVTPDAPFAVIRESELDRFGSAVECTTVFLTASQCPIGCIMCDLWKNTLSHATPAGAIPQQIDFALDPLRALPIQDEASCIEHKLRYLKLYNSGNFFDSRSIPPSDYAAIAQRCQAFDRVIVENHPRIGGQRLLEFNDMLKIPLEVAVGLETVQPRWLGRLQKQMTRDEFDSYAEFLLNHHIDLRVFLMIGVPGVSANESIRWARMSVRHATLAGARHISLIPARAGNGWDGQGDQLPSLSQEHLSELHQLAIEDTKGFAVVTVDQWGDVSG